MSEMLTIRSVKTVLPDGVRPATVVVGGSEFNGISTMVVIPPAAAARVAVANPSHSVRPGSLTCTCESTSPGMITRLP